MALRPIPLARSTRSKGNRSHPRRLGWALLPGYGRNFPPWSVIGRPLAGDDQPTIDLVVGFNRTNMSPTLKLFLPRLDAPIARCKAKSSHIVGSAEAG